MQCKNCGSLLNVESKTCTMCGTPVEIEPVEVPVESEVIAIPVENEEVVQPTENTIQMITPVINSQNVSEDVTMFNNNYESKKSKSGIVIAIIAIVVILAGILGFIFYLTRSPKMIFNNFVNQTFKAAESTLVSFKNVKGSMTIEPKISSSSDSSGILDVINNAFVSFDYEIDYEGKTALVGIDTKYDNDKLVNLDVVLKADKGYVLLEGLYDKYISTDVEGIDKIFESLSDVKDQRTLLMEVRKTLIKSLKSNYFEKESVEITVDGEKIKTIKNSLILDKVNQNNIMKDLLTELKENDSFLESAANISNITKEEVIDTIEDALDELETTELNSEVTERMISIYTKGIMNEVVRIEVSYEEAGENQYINITKDGDTFIIDISAGENKGSGLLKVTEDNGTTAVEFEIKDDTTGDSIGLTLTYKVSFDETITNINVSNNIDVNTLTEEDSSKILMSLMENPGVVKLMEDFNDLSFGFGDVGYGDDIYVDEYPEDDYYLENNFGY